MAYRLKIKSRFYIVASFKEASALYEAKRDASGQGASRFRDGEVFEGETLVARVSYNGRVWPPTEWTEDSKPIYDNRLAA